MNDIKNTMRKNKFVKNNGAVIRAINILRTDFVNLYDVAAALEPQLSKDEVMDSANYLLEAGYIRTVKIRTHTPASCIGKDFDDLAAKLTAKGIQLVNGAFNDPCVDL